jgi:hypothetical protein
MGMGESEASSLGSVGEVQDANVPVIRNVREAATGNRTHCCSHWLGRSLVRERIRSGDFSETGEHAVPLREVTPGMLVPLLLHAWVRVQVSFFPHSFSQKETNDKVMTVCNCHVSCNNHGNETCLHLTMTSCVFNCISFRICRKNHVVKIADRYFENVAKFRYLGTTITKQNLIQEETEFG